MNVTDTSIGSSTWPKSLSEARSRLRQSLHAARRGESMTYAFFLGFVLGPIGVWMVLRSWLEALLLMAALTAVAVLAPELPTFVFWTFWGVWILIRLYFKQQPKPQPSSVDPSVREASTI